MSRKGCDHFEAELVRLIDRQRLDYELSYAEALGCLTLVKSRLTTEALENDNEGN